MKEGMNEWSVARSQCVEKHIYPSQWGKAFYSYSGIERQEIQSFPLAIKCFTSDPFWGVKS